MLFFRPSIYTTVHAAMLSNNHIEEAALCYGRTNLLMQGMTSKHCRVIACVHEED